MKPPHSKFEQCCFSFSSMTYRGSTTLIWTVLSKIQIGFWSLFRKQAENCLTLSSHCISFISSYTGASQVVYVHIHFQTLFHKVWHHCFVCKSICWMICSCLKASFSFFLHNLDPKYQQNSPLKLVRGLN